MSGFVRSCHETTAPQPTGEQYRRELHALLKLAQEDGDTVEVKELSRLIFEDARRELGPCG